MAARVFWQDKSLQDMTDAEWESLCDGCGKCCVHKLEDEDTGEVYHTDVACYLLNTDTCQCSNYTQRFRYVPDCIVLKRENVEEFHWLPLTCAYRLLAEGKPLYDWHPLVSGSADSTRTSGMSMAGRVVSERDTTVDMNNLEERIIHWVL